MGCRFLCVSRIFLITSDGSIERGQIFCCELMVFVRTLPSHVLPPMKYSLPDSLPCEEAGLSTKDLTPSLFSLRPSLETLKKLAATLGAPIVDLTLRKMGQ